MTLPAFPPSTTKLVGTMLYLLGLSIVSAQGPEKEGPDGPTFSTTEKWDPSVLIYAGRNPKFLPATWKEEIRLAPAPTAISERTKQELAALLVLQQKRTSSQEDQIRAEAELKGFRFGPHKYSAIMNGQNFPATKRLLEAAFEDSSIAMFALKRSNNRARPRHLEPRLKPVVPPPGHPAYPSGHATQSQLFGLLLAECDPSHQRAILADADRIARNREIAGVHYRSDTIAGQALARKLHELLSKNDRFAKLLEAAKAEWR